ncbi:hypothetical protein Barb6XT_02433 [Bacteroidales bacterium Barb6XT]|nr:hypothetical protein Barb6XT_02433 [Bacteroidales bacterium Barb6XT]
MVESDRPCVKSNDSISDYALKSLLFNIENRVVYHIILKARQIKSFLFILYLFNGIIVRLYLLVKDACSQGRIHMHCETIEGLFFIRLALC